MLPTPLNLSQQGGNQRANAILYFDVPRVAPSVFSTLQDSALLSTARRITTREERQVLEAELRQRIQVTESGGSPGRPGTPGSSNTITIREGHLDPQALADLQSVIDNLRSAGSGPASRFVPQLTEELEDFGSVLGGGAREALEGVIRRIETGVLGDGFDFGDFFQDPGLFFGIGFGLIEFSAGTNHQASDALHDVIRQLGHPRLHDGNPNNDSVQAIGSAVDRLRRALDDEDNAAPALTRFLDRIGGAPQGGDAYALRIADLLDETLADLKIGAPDLAAVQKLQATLQAVRNLENISGSDDDRLREQAGADVQGIIDRYATITTRTQTTAIPGEPAVPATPATQTLTILQEATLVPRVEVAERVVTIYNSIQESLKPLQKLAQPPDPVPSVKVLAAPPEQEGKEDLRRISSGSDDEQDGGFVVRPPYRQEDRPGTGLPPAPARPGAAGFGTAGIGQFFDSRA